jgi:hypothetical protein
MVRNFVAFPDKKFTSRFALTRANPPLLLRSLFKSRR